MSQETRAERKAAQLAHFQGLDKHKVAHFINAYVYGNILILAAIISIKPEYVGNGHAALLTLGTGLATFVAHVFAETQEYEVLRKEGEDPAQGRKAALVQALKDSRPILTSTFLPALVFALGFWGLLHEDLAIQLALWIIGLRIFRIGFVVAKYRGEKASFKLVIRGIVLAFMALAIAELKVLLTH